MKKLLLIAALVAPTWLYSCMPKSVVPTPAVIVQETFDNLPALPEVREIPLDVPSVAPALPSYKPKARMLIVPAVLFLLGLSLALDRLLDRLLIKARWSIYRRKKGRSASSR
jgi:hypothetical protein